MKKLSATDKPNNQSKLANVGGTPLPPGQMKCNILKGITCLKKAIAMRFLKKDISYFSPAREEAGQTAKLTNQLFVQSANFANNNDENYGAATLIAVVSLVLCFMSFATIIRIYVYM